MTSLYENELDVAVKAVLKAAALCRDVQGNLAGAGTLEKKDRSPVTVADFGSQAVILHDLLSAFPEDAIVGEEDARILTTHPDLKEKVGQFVRAHSDITSEHDLIRAVDAGAHGTGREARYWTLDPIDGTKGFLRGDQYAIALALIEQGKVVLSVLGLPNFQFAASGGGSLFYAIAGQGAYGRGIETAHKNLEPAKISTDGLTDPAQARFCESVESAHAAHEEHLKISELIGIAKPPFRIDSQAKYAAVATGKASVYLRMPRSRDYREKIWDHAAGLLVVEESGGRVTDFSGNPLDFTVGHQLNNNTGILVTNGCLHDRALKAIMKIV